MKIAHQHGGRYTLNFAPTEDVMVVLKEWCLKNQIKAAHITGLGASRSVELAYYNLTTKVYERTLIKEDLEIISLTGNIGEHATTGDLIIHLHGCFGRRDLSLLGGHIFSLIISGAGEIHLETMPGTLKREFESNTGLTLMCGL